MKKFIVTVLCAVVTLCSISFAACSSSSDSGLINLADCEIGYELPVYPDCEFDYKVDDDCVVHISEIKAVLTAKNEINAGDLVEDKFYRYEITLSANGYTNNNAKSEYTINITYGIFDPTEVFMMTAETQSDNSLQWEEKFYINSYSSDLIFKYIR